MSAKKSLKNFGKTKIADISICLEAKILKFGFYIDVNLSFNPNTLNLDLKIFCNMISFLKMFYWPLMFLWTIRKRKKL